MAEKKAAEKKEEPRVKAFAVANLNAQRTNMRIELNNNRVPVLTIKGSPFHDAHMKDCEALGLKPQDGYAWSMDDGLTITGEESLKILAEAGVEFPGADQFVTRGRKAAKISGGLAILNPVE